MSADILEICPGALKAQDEIRDSEYHGPPNLEMAQMLRDLADAAERGELSAVVYVAAEFGADRPIIGEWGRDLSPYLLLSGVTVVSQMLHEEISADLDADFSVTPSA